MADLIPNIPAERWGVWCRVSGGVTGTREAWLRAGDQLMLFARREDAERLALDLDCELNGPHATADFAYAARRFSSNLAPEQLREKRDRFVARLSLDVRERIAAGEFAVDQDAETGLCLLVPGRFWGETR
jgi:hypothetical protein